MAPAEETSTASDKPAASTKETSVLFCGSSKWDLMGRKAIPASLANTGAENAGDEYLAPMVVTALEGRNVAKVVSGPVSCHAFALASDGVLYAWGRNQNGQLGLRDTKTRACPQVVTAFSHSRVVDVAAGRNHSLVLLEDGTVYGMGSNRCGQLGLGSLTITECTKPEKVKDESMGDSKASFISCGADFSIIGTESGELYSFGHPEYGQTGHGTDGEYIEGRKSCYNYDTSPKLIASLIKDKVHIMSVKCGVNHSVALDKEGKVWTWGMGGYGRLGHRGPSDEYRPKCIERTSNITAVYAGSKFCYATSKFKQTYFWGQTKSSGEATMYPKPMHDLTGWVVGEIAAGPSSTIVAAGESVITWGPSPAFGELGYGDGEKRRGIIAKSSTKPKLVDALEGCHAIGAGMGTAFSLILVCHKTEKDTAIIKKLGSLTEGSMDPVPSMKVSKKMGTKKAEAVKKEVKADVKETKANTKKEGKANVKKDAKSNVKKDARADVKQEGKADVNAEAKDTKADVKKEVDAESKDTKGEEVKKEVNADTEKETSEDDKKEGKTSATKEVKVDAQEATKDAEEDAKADLEKEATSDVEEEADVDVSKEAMVDVKDEAKAKPDVSKDSVTKEGNVNVEKDGKAEVQKKARSGSDKDDKEDVVMEPKEAVDQGADEGADEKADEGAGDDSMEDSEDDTKKVLKKADIKKKDAGVEKEESDEADVDEKEEADVEKEEPSPAAENVRRSGRKRKATEKAVETTRTPTRSPKAKSPAAKAKASAASSSMAKASTPKSSTPKGKGKAKAKTPTRSPAKRRRRT